MHIPSVGDMADYLAQSIVKPSHVLDIFGKERAGDPYSVNGDMAPSGVGPYSQLLEVKSLKADKDNAMADALALHKFK